MRKMPFRFARRVRNLEIKTYCPKRKQDSDYLNGQHSGRSSFHGSTSSGSQQICPSCVFPIVVAFIFGFTVIQLVVIHRTIVAYKSRSLAFEEVYGPSHNETKSQGDLLAFSKKFDAAWGPPQPENEAGKGNNGPRESYSSSFLPAPFSSSSKHSGGVEWRPSQSYPYRMAHYPPPNINHIWGVACAEVSTKLHGNITINVKKDVSLENLTKHNPQVLPGGKWKPEDCSPRFHVALIIPYRFRWSHLKLLLSVLHPMLRRQQMSYQIFVAEQYGNYTFNKGLLMNAAFLLALNSSTAFNCVIFHDVDLLPETEMNLYGCANSPSHLSVSIDAYGYRLPYSKLVGGVFAISVDHFIQVNGYSNLYWGWGAEDDDMYKRLIANQLPLNRPRPDLAKYKMLQHGRRVPNQFITPLIRSARLRWTQDGLTTCHFRLVSKSTPQLFTHFLVDVGQPSYSVLEPNIPLEKLIPPSSSSSVLSLRTSSSSPNSHSHPPHLGLGHHEHTNSKKQQKRSIVPTLRATPIPSERKVGITSISKDRRKQNELFMLSGIARDNDNQLGHQSTNSKSLSRSSRESGGNGVSSHNTHQQHLSLSQDKGNDDEKGNGRNGQLFKRNAFPESDTDGVDVKGKSKLDEKGRLNDIPLDPDVPMEQEEEDEEIGEDV